MWEGDGEGREGGGCYGVEIATRTLRDFFLKGWFFGRQA